MPTLTHTTELVTTSCWCGIPFAIPAQLHREMNDSGHACHCPNGHTMVYKDSYKDQLARERARHDQEMARKREQLERERRSHSATRGVLTKTKKRVGHGVCPCCNRSFQNLKRHMGTKHPEYVDAKEIT